MSRAAIIELLHAGMSDRAIARQVHTHTSTVAQVRTELGLPKHKPGPTPAGSAEDMFWRRAVPTVDGHLLWPYAGATIRTGHEGPRVSAARIAFRLGNKREPIGKVRAGCDQAGCVHPSHVEDQQMRDQYRAIFAA